MESNGSFNFLCVEEYNKLFVSRLNFLSNVLYRAHLTQFLLNTWNNERIVWIKFGSLIIEYRR